MLTVSFADIFQANECCLITVLSTGKGGISMMTSLRRSCSVTHTVLPSQHTHMLCRSNWRTQLIHVHKDPLGEPTAAPGHLVGILIRCNERLKAKEMPKVPEAFKMYSEHAPSSTFQQSLWERCPPMDIT